MSKTLADKIINLRNNRGLSQKELATLAKVPQSAISDIETGKRLNPGIVTITAIANALNIKISDLLE